MSKSKYRLMSEIKTIYLGRKNCIGVYMQTRGSLVCPKNKEKIEVFIREMLCVVLKENALALAKFLGAGML